MSSVMNTSAIKCPELYRGPVGRSLVEQISNDPAPGPTSKFRPNNSLTYLLPANEVWVKVMFSQARASHSVHGGVPP